MGKSGTELVFQLWACDSGIFLKKDEYAHLLAIKRALEKAQTWGEFERLCPDGEFAKLSLWHENGGEYVYEVDGVPRFVEAERFEELLEELGRDYVITPEHTFDSSLIPGVEEADYPPWLESTAEDILPEEFIKTFAEVASGGPASGGSWTEYEASEIDEMVSWLEARGFSVTVHLDYD